MSRGRYFRVDVLISRLVTESVVGLKQIFTPILHWIEGKHGPTPKPVNYPYGSRGPKELEAFIAKYGYKRANEG